MKEDVKGSKTPPIEMLRALANEPLDDDEDEGEATHDTPESSQVDGREELPSASRAQVCDDAGNFSSPHDHPNFDGDEELRRALEEGRVAALKSNTLFIGDLIAEPIRKVKSYVPHLAIPGGLSMLSAEPKCGKTTLLFWALGSLTTGQSFLGEECHKTKVLYASEQSSNIIKDQLEKYPVPPLKGNRLIRLIPFEKNGKLQPSVFDDDGNEVFFRQPHKNWEEQLNFWAGELRTSGAKVLVIDTFSAFSMLASGDAVDSGVVSQKLTQLKQSVFSVNRDIAIVVLHHLRKSSGSKSKEPDFNDIANSFGMRALPDCNLLLSKKKGSPEQRIFKGEGRLGEFTKTIELRQDGFQVVGDTQNEPLAEPQDIQNRIWDMCRENLALERLSLREFAVRTGVTKHQVVKFRQAYGDTYFTDAGRDGRLAELVPYVPPRGNV